MATYLLDTQVVSYFLQARRKNELATAAATSRCMIVDEVRGELAADPIRGVLFERWLPRSHLEVSAISLGSPAELLLTRLSAGSLGREALVNVQASRSLQRITTWCSLAWTGARCGSRFASCGHPASG